MKKEINNEVNIIELKKEWKDIAKKIKIYDKKYSYGQALIEDSSYDALKSKLKDIENIIGKQKNSPLDVIGEVEEETVPHKHPMLSLDHGYGTDSISKFYQKIHNAIKKVPTMILEHKIDGIAASIRYKDGNLEYVLTRGDGASGIDITKQSEYIDGIPKNISENDFEVRGEIYMSFVDFEKTSEFKSPRNATAGILRNKSLDFIAAHKLKFIAHGFISSDFDSYESGIKFLNNNGFKTPKYYLSKSENESAEIFNRINREKIEYPIDGIVLKINNLDICEKLGAHRTAPKYAFAAKFPPKNSKTFIENIEMQVGKFGSITPVAIVDPIEIDGVRIQKVSMHNMQELKNKNYKIGDEIILARAGDVIPYILEKISSSKNVNSPQDDTEICPSCSSKLIWESVSMKCTNQWNCKSQAILRIEHFISRKAMNISGLGNKNIEKLFDAKILQKPVDIFKIKDLVLKNDYQIKSLLGSKVAKNIYEKIEENRKISLHKFIYALCIPNVGYGNAKTISDNCESFENFIKTFSKNEIEIKSLGPVIINSIKKFINEEKWIFNAYEELLIG